MVRNSVKIAAAVLLCSLLLLPIAQCDQNIWACVIGGQNQGDHWKTEYLGKDGWSLWQWIGSFLYITPIKYPVAGGKGKGISSMFGGTGMGGGGVGCGPLSSWAFESAPVRKCEACKR